MFGRLVVLATLLAAPVGAADRVANPAADLERLRARIESVRARLEADAQQRESAARDVRAAELAVQAARQRVAEVRAQRQAGETRLAELKREQAAEERRVAAERAALAAQLRMAYIMGREEPLVLLLNQRSPGDLSRLAVYYGYFAAARTERLTTLVERLAHLELLAERAEQAVAQLQAAEEALTRETQALTTARRQRAQLLAAIQTRIRSRGEQVTQLERQAKALERLIEEAQRAARDLPTPGTRGFGRAQGKLPWPVAGKVVANFGEPRAGGPLKWEGLLIAAPAGTQVRAAYHGRVVYADHLYGMGLMVMIDHGDGYSSIYGNQEQIFTRVGDMVAPGDVLGVLAERSGGANPRGELHFEIRKGKQALDPRRWLAKP